MKYIKYLLILFIILIPIKVNALEINSKNAILYNMNDDEILFEKDSEKEVPIASLTKIMTSIIAIENIDDINETVTIPEEGLEGLVGANASVAGFKLNEKVTYKDLLYGSLLPSGADATQTLAYYVAGGIDGYVKLMNEKASELNLKHTHFSDVTGLDDVNNYSSVKDIATLLKYALKNDTFKEIFTATSYTTSNKRLKLESTLLYYTNTYKLDNKYIYGSNVTKLDSEEHYGDGTYGAQPEKKRKVRREKAAKAAVQEKVVNPEKEAAIRRNKERLLVFDWKYTIITAVAIIICVAAALMYVQGTVRLNNLSAQIADLKSEKENLLSEQNALQTEIDKNINLDEIRTFAEEELHMVYPGADQIIYYNSSTEDYFRQYESVDTAN